jgi:calcium/calmodulin-dependent protein kinase I
MHRDLKPDNILLKNPNDITDIVIADFGLASYYKSG